MPSNLSLAAVSTKVGHWVHRARKSHLWGSSLSIHRAEPQSRGLGQPSPCHTCRSPPGPRQLLGRDTAGTSAPPPLPATSQRLAQVRMRASDPKGQELGHS